MFVIPKRKGTRAVRLGSVVIGDYHPIVIQSMTNTNTEDTGKTLKQINRLATAGCQVVRVGITTNKDIEALEIIVANSPIPIIADIQYNYLHAIEAVKCGASGIRLNPGYIKDREKLKQIVDICKENNISIRVGVNSGSVDDRWIKEFNGVNEKSLVYSALDQIKMLEDLDFTHIKVAIKSSDVMTMINANRMFSNMSDYPLHLGVTEAGPPSVGSIKSSIGIGTLLAEGIGDTLRVSLTGDPVEEVIVAKKILKSLNLLQEGINLVSCPTCSRTKIDLIDLVNRAEKELEKIDENITVAIMGCPVNGPGEAKEADIGISCGQGEGFIFIKGEIIKRIPEESLLEELIEMIKERQW